MSPFSLTPPGEGAGRVSPSCAKVLGELFQRADLHLPDGADPLISLTGLEDDSRRVREGFLFVAVRGEEVDGHDFIAQALRDGAAFIVADHLPEDLDADLAQIPEGFERSLPAGDEAGEEIDSEKNFRMAGPKILLVPDTHRLLGRLAQAYVGLPSEFLQLIGITGTNGKTTTAFLVEAALRNLRRYPALFSTVEYRLGGEKRDAPTTTPGALDLARMMALALERDADSVVMEVSSHALIQGRLEGLEFDVALMSNLTQDHLDYHQTMEEYAEAKRLLFTRHKPRVAVFNLDDPTARDFSENFDGSQITYSLDLERAIDLKADIYPTVLSMDARGVDMTVRFNCKGTSRTLALRSALRGRFNASNLLAAASVCAALGLAPEQIVAGLRGARGAPGRFEAILAGQDFALYVDYAHTPDAVENLLENVRDLTRGRIIVVLGCGGDRDPGKRPIMGAAMGRLADYGIITNDNPRGEAPDLIAEAVEEGIKTTASPGDYEIILDRREAIRRAIEMATPADAVVIAGKGHEDYQIIQGERTHFDDRETAREIINQKNAESARSQDT